MSAPSVTALATQRPKGLAAMFREFPQVEFVLLQDVPVSGVFGPRVQARALHLKRPLEQRIPVADYLGQTASYESLLTALQMQHPNVTLARVQRFFCDAMFCYGVEGHKQLYNNEDHVNDEGARRLRPLLDDIFGRVASSTS